MTTLVHFWTGELNAALIKAYGGGVSVQQIADQLGVSVASVTGQAYRLGCVHGVKLSPLQRQSLAESRNSKRRIDQAYNDSRRNKHRRPHDLGGPHG